MHLGIVASLTLHNIIIIPSFAEQLLDGLFVGVKIFLSIDMLTCEVLTLRNTDLPLRFAV